MIRIVLSSLLLGVGVQAWAQTPGDSSVVASAATLVKPTMEELWVEMPDSLMPLLTSRERMDARDYAQSGMQAEVSNLLGGKSLLEYLGENRVEVQLTPSSTWSAYLLSGANDEQVICVIHTLMAQQPQSTIAFYTTMWQPLPTQRFLPAELQTQQNSGWGKLQFMADSLTLTHQTHYLHATAPGEVNDASIVANYVWNGSAGHFVPRVEDTTR